MILPPSFSNLSNLVCLRLTNFTFQGFKNSVFNSQSFYLSFKIEEEFPSCFQNMTRLTNLFLDSVRGGNPEPIPFPTEFCNMIYLKGFNSELNNFSGLF